MFFTLSKLAFFILRPSNFLLIILGLGVVLLFANRTRAAKWFAGGAFAGFLVLGLSPVGNILMQSLEDRFPIPRDVPDVTGIIVLGGAIDTIVTSARPTTGLNSSAERVVEIAKLARQFPNAKIIHTGGEGLLLGSGTSEAEGVLPILLSFGINENRLILEDESRNTWENATLTKEAVQPQPGQRWLLVTSAFHMPRAVGVFQAAGWSGVTPYPVDFRTRGPQDRGRWFIGVAEGLKRTDIAVRELIGLVAYYVSGRSSALLPGP